jgi:hypothetical protein
VIRVIANDVAKVVNSCKHTAAVTENTGAEHRDQEGQAGCRAHASVPLGRRGEVLLHSECSPNASTHPACASSSPPAVCVNANSDASFFTREHGKQLAAQKSGQPQSIGLRLVCTS